jgi:hypothetical protein
MFHMMFILSLLLAGNTSVRAADGSLYFTKNGRISGVESACMSAFGDAKVDGCSCCCVPFNDGRDGRGIAVSFGRLSKVLSSRKLSKVSKLLNSDECQEREKNEMICRLELSIKYGGHLQRVEVVIARYSYITACVFISHTLFNCAFLPQSSVLSLLLLF